MENLLFRVIARLSDLHPTCCLMTQMPHVPDHAKLDHGVALAVAYQAVPIVTLLFKDFLAKVPASYGGTR